MIKELQTLSTKLKQTLWKSNGALDIPAWGSEATKILTSRFSTFGNVSGTKLCGRLVNSIRCGETFLTASNQSLPEKLVNQTVKNVWHENELEKNLVTETRKKSLKIKILQWCEQDDKFKFLFKTSNWVGRQEAEIKIQIAQAEKTIKDEKVFFLTETSRSTYVKTCT